MRTRTTLQTLVLSCLALSLGAACRAAPQDGGGESTAYTQERLLEDGVPTLVNHGGPKFTGEIFRYEKVVELRTDDGNPESVLHFAETFTMGDDGSFYVADTRRHRVAVFDAQGGYVRSIGQEGDGPGDLRAPFDVTFVDGALQVLGSRGYRLTVYALDGTLVDVVNHGEGDRPRAMVRTADGTRVVITAPFERGTEFQGYYARATVLSAGGDMVAEISSDWVRSALMVSVDGLRYISPVQYAAGPQALFAQNVGAGEGEIVLTSGIEPLVLFYGLDGQLRRRIRLDLAPQPVTEAERRAIADDLDRRIVDAPEQSNERERILGKVELRVRRDNMVFEEPRAYWGAAAVDDRGAIWLRHSHPVAQDFYANNEYRFRVVGPEGDYLGDTAWPRIQGAGQVVRGHLLAMVFNEETLQVVPTVFRIEPAVADLAY